MNHLISIHYYDESENINVATEEPFVFVSLFLLRENYCQKPHESNFTQQHISSLLLYPPSFF